MHKFLVAGIDTTPRRREHEESSEDRGERREKKEKEKRRKTSSNLVIRSYPGSNTTTTESATFPAALNLHFHEFHTNLRTPIISRGVFDRLRIRDIPIYTSSVRTRGEEREELHDKYFSAQSASDSTVAVCLSLPIRRFLVDVAVGETENVPPVNAFNRDVSVPRAI